MLLLEEKWDVILAVLVDNLGKVIWIKKKRSKGMRSCCVTDVGQKRTTNQDFVFASDTPVGPLPNLLIVADGMGGHQAGAMRPK